MEIGFLTWYFKQTQLEELFKWADANGFSGIELDDCPDDLDFVKKIISKYPRVRIFALGRARNFLFGDNEDRKAVASLLTRDIEIASELGIGVINIFAGKDPNKSIEDNLKLFQDVFTPLAIHAEKHKVYLAMENCAQRNWWPTGGNLAHTPELWRKLFDLVPSKHIGLTIDPSHFIWQRMDYLKAMKEFGDRIYWAHAKDCEVHQDILADRGIYGENWWHYRLPGWGEMNWAGFFTILREIGYTGPIGIEHEDRYWNKNDEEIKHGLKMAKNFLNKFEY
ncbi:MAG: sugar phosphate isomerase/epimerase [Anaerolineaceae bacterium]|nr:sugar phosphate isomerase/epimerase [Anaerolineaceae bacterium]